MVPILGCFEVENVLETTWASQASNIILGFETLSEDDEVPDTGCLFTLNSRTRCIYYGLFSNRLEKLHRKNRY